MNPEFQPNKQQISSEDDTELVNNLRKQLLVEIEKTKKLERQLEEEKKILEKIEGKNEINLSEAEDQLEAQLHSLNPPPLPILFLGTDKLYKFKPFKIHLYVSTQWKLMYNVSNNDILDICSQISCCEEGTLEPLSCHVCGANSLISFGIASPQTFDSEKITDLVERYTFDSCRSNCSSSRDHLKARLVAVIKGLPGCNPVISHPFAMQARIKTKKLYKETQTSDSNAFTNEAPAFASIIDSPISVPVQTQVTSEDFEITSSPLIIEPKVIIQVISSSFTQEEIDHLCSDLHTKLKDIPGMIAFDRKIYDKLFILYFSYLLPENTKIANETVKAFFNFGHQNGIRLIGTFSTL